MDQFFQKVLLKIAAQIQNFYHSSHILYTTSLINLNKPKTINDPDYFLKKLFPEKYQAYLDKIQEIESFTPIKSKYGGEWIMQNFDIKPGPMLGKIKQFWTQKYGDQLDNMPEDELRKDTDIYIKSL